MPSIRLHLLALSALIAAAIPSKALGGWIVPDPVATGTAPTANAVVLTELSTTIDTVVVEDCNGNLTSMSGPGFVDFVSNPPTLTLPVGDVCAVTFELTSDIRVEALMPTINTTIEADVALTELPITLPPSLTVATNATEQAIVNIGEDGWLDDSWPGGISVTLHPGGPVYQDLVDALLASTLTTVALP